MHACIEESIACMHACRGRKHACMHAWVHTCMHAEKVRVHARRVRKKEVWREDLTVCWGENRKLK
jgi:hypothetical protein